MQEIYSWVAIEIYTKICACTAVDSRSKNIEYWYQTYSSQ